VLLQCLYQRVPPYKLHLIFGTCSAAAVSVSACTSLQVAPYLWHLRCVCISVYPLTSCTYLWHLQCCCSVCISVHLLTSCTLCGTCSVSVSACTPLQVAPIFGTCSVAAVSVSACTSLQAAGMQQLWFTFLASRFGVHFDLWQPMNALQCHTFSSCGLKERMRFSLSHACMLNSTLTRANACTRTHTHTRTHIHAHKHTYTNRLPSPLSQTFVSSKRPCKPLQPSVGGEHGLSSCR